ncbi:hypothetical protein Prudu_021455, partial [Prunus dulcis]
STAKRVRRHGVDPNRSLNEEITIKTSRRAKCSLSLSFLSLPRATSQPPPFQSLPSPPQGDSISGKGTVTSASVSPIFPDQLPAVGRLETIGNCRFLTEVTRTSFLSISSVSQPNQSSEIDFTSRLFDFRIENWPNFGRRDRPFPATFWGLSKNKSDSKRGVLPRIGIWSLGSKIFRRTRIALDTRSARACGGAWARVVARLWPVLRSSCRHERVGFRGSRFGVRLSPERISHIARSVGAVSFNCWIALNFGYVGLRTRSPANPQEGPSRGPASSDQQ